MCEEKNGFHEKLSSLLDRCHSRDTLVFGNFNAPMELSANFVLVPTDLVAGTTSVFDFSALQSSEA